MTGKSLLTRKRLSWLVISAATWIAARDIDKAEEFFKKNRWKW